MPTNAFERGQRAKRKGRLLEANPFLRRRESKGNSKKISDWALGWHSATAMKTVVAADWQWPPIVKMPVTQAGDYERRERGLYALMRPRDLLEYDVLCREMAAGAVSWVPQWAVVPYDLLRAYALERGEDLGDPSVDEPGWHPLLWLWSARRIQKGGSHWPPLITSAYEEMMDARTTPEALRPAEVDDSPEE